MVSAVKAVPREGRGAIVECDKGGSTPPFRAVFEKAAVGLAQIDVLGRFRHVNQAFLDIFGYSSDELMDHAFNWRQLVVSEDRDADQATLDQLGLGTNESITQARRCQRKDGRVAWVDLSARLILDEGAAQGFVVTAVDVTEQKQVEETMRQHAFYDGMTRLPNRRLLLDRLQQTMALARRAGTRVGLLFIDLDKFKPINDELGHAVGDWLLQAVAQSLTKCLRAYDTAARFGGDEFVVLLPDLAEAEESLIIAERIRVALEKPFITPAGKPLSISSSIGVALFPDHADNERGLLHVGDTAMYQAKRTGRNKIVCPESGCVVDAEGAAGNRGGGSFLHLSWETKNASGNATIDAEHRNLFKQGNQLLDTAMRADVDPVAFKAALKRLLGLMAAHFHSEEEILRQQGFPGLAEHAANHAKLSERAKILQKQSDDRGISVGELVDFLVVEVITKHILQEDRTYFQCFGGGSEPSHEDSAQPAGAC
jgi:diguanylate cyclase (GGDEF)-like protein/PAS domain S-box-containing protein/hemerythrin-like metal-binding protein